MQVNTSKMYCFTFMLLVVITKCSAGVLSKKEYELEGLIPYKVS